MPDLRIILNALWPIAPVLQAIMALIMFRRKLHREFPFFFSYMIFHVLRTFVLLFVHSASHWTYFCVYWSVELIDAVFTFAVIFEIFQHVFKPYEAVRNIAMVVFRWAGVVLICLASLSAVLASNAEKYPIMAGIFALDRSVFLMQAGLLLFLFMFASSLGLTWRNYLFGIAVGFAILASSELIVISLRAYAGWQAGVMYALLRPAAYNCAVLIWLGYLLQPQPAALHIKMPAPNRMEAWNQALTDFMYRA